MFSFPSALQWNVVYCGGNIFNAVINWTICEFIAIVWRREKTVVFADVKQGSNTTNTEKETNTNESTWKSTQFHCNLNVNAYSVSDMLSGASTQVSNAFRKSNLSLRNLLYGQIVTYFGDWTVRTRKRWSVWAFKKIFLTVGNGIVEIGCIFSLRDRDTGVSYHFKMPFRIDEQHIRKDKTNAIAHHSRSLQCRLRSEKYRIPCIELLLQKSLKFRRIFGITTV